MHISERGVAYNPSTVQHQIRIKQTLTKGLVFGVLDVRTKEIIWLEMTFRGQIVQSMNVEAIRFTDNGKRLTENDLTVKALGLKLFAVNR